MKYKKNKTKLKNNFNKNKKAISPLISTILLVLVAAILVATFSSWSKMFVKEKMNDTSQSITTASDFECSRSNLDIESCTINAITKDVTLLVHNPSSLDYKNLILSIQARDDVDNNTFKLYGKFNNNLEPGQSLLLKTEEDFTYTKEEMPISELRLSNIDLMTLTSLTCPNKIIDISNCEEIYPLIPTINVIALTTSDTHPDLNGIISDTSATLSLILDGTTYIPTNDEDGTWSLTGVSELSSGSYDVNICATDTYDRIICDESDTNELTIEITCPTGYVLVPNDSTYNTGDFCVMQFEAKVDNDEDDTGDSYSSCQYGSYHVWDNHASSCSYAESGRSLVSSIEGYPLTYLTQPEAKTACESIGTGYHLITNDEWMTIARNLESQSTNWSDETVGSEFIPRGNSNGSYALDDATVLSGINQRNLVLSNGNEIYDLAGNVSEWVDKTIQRKDMPPVSTGWLEYTAVTNYGVLERKAYNFDGTDYDSTNGIGKLYNYYLAGSTHEKVFLRGGYWYRGTLAGLLSLYLYDGSSGQYYYRGFRCSVVP